MAHRVFVDTPLGTAHVREAGSGDPLLLLHQWPRSSRMFDQLVPRLATERQVIAVDTPGCGLSGPPAGGAMTVESLAEFMTQVLDALEVEAVDVFGVHMGTCIGAEMSLATPARIRRLAMFGYPLMLDEDDRTAIATMTSGAVAAWDNSGEPSFLIQRWNRIAGDMAVMRLLDDVAPTEVRSPSELAFVDNFLQDISDGQEHALAVIQAMLDYDSQARLPELRLPCLHLEAGSPFDVDVCQRGTEVAALIPGCQAVAIPAVDGNVAEWHGRELAERLQAFFGATEESLRHGR